MQTVPKPKKPVTLIFSSFFVPRFVGGPNFEKISKTSSYDTPTKFFGSVRLKFLTKTALTSQHFWPTKTFHEPECL